MTFTPDSVAALQARLLADALRLAPEAVLVAAIVALLLHGIDSGTGPG